MSEPDDRALETLTQLRKGGPSAVLGSRRGVGVFDVTGHRVAGSTVPFTPDQDSVEFELMIRHPIPYPSVSLDLHTPDASGQSSLSTTASLEVMETCVVLAGKAVRPANAALQNRRHRGAGF